ncbi:MAG: hypothetical protein HC914_16730, partial [Chloroflexaceae bacterium]|nr:hypothetical protein [Chloroflexaceae bacterium]
RLTEALEGWRITGPAPAATAAHGAVMGKLVLGPADRDERQHAALRCRARGRATGSTRTSSASTTATGFVCWFPLAFRHSR